MFGVNQNIKKYWLEITVWVEVCTLQVLFYFGCFLVAPSRRIQWKAVRKMDYHTHLASRLYLQRVTWRDQCPLCFDRLVKLHTSIRLSVHHLTHSSSSSVSPALCLLLGGRQRSSFPRSFPLLSCTHSRFLAYNCWWKLVLSSLAAFDIRSLLQYACLFFIIYLEAACCSLWMLQNIIWICLTVWPHESYLR